ICNPLIDAQALRGSTYGGTDGGHVSGTTDLSTFMCWLDPDRMKAHLVAELDAQAPDICSTQTEAERQKALAGKQKQLDKLEHNEESLICEAEAAGLEIARRPDARPEIVLLTEGA